MNAEHPPQSRDVENEAAVDLWARTRAAGDHPDPWDQPSEPVAVTIVQPCTCGGGPRPHSRLAATCRALLGWTPTYRFDPARPTHRQLGDLPAYRRTRPPIVFAERVPRLYAWRHAPSLRRGHRRPLAWWGHRPPPKRPRPGRLALVPAGVVHPLLVRRAAGQAGLAPDPPLAGPLAGLASPPDRC
jgi:hypothetical protein